MALIAVGVGTSSLLAGCGDDSGGDSGDEGGSGKSQETASCCLGKSYYECPDGDAAQACFGNLSPGDCERDDSKDQACQ